MFQKQNYKCNKFGKNVPKNASAIRRIEFVSLPVEPSDVLSFIVRFSNVFGAGWSVQRRKSY